MLDNALAKVFCTDDHFAVFDGGRDQSDLPVDAQVKMQMLQTRIRDREQRRKMLEDSDDGDETWVLQLLEESVDEQQTTDQFQIELDDKALLDDQLSIACTDDPAQILEIDCPQYFLRRMTAIEAQIITRAEQIKRERLLAKQSKSRTVWSFFKNTGANISKSRPVKA